MWQQSSLDAARELVLAHPESAIQQLGPYRSGGGRCAVLPAAIRHGLSAEAFLRTNMPDAGFAEALGGWVRPDYQRPRRDYRASRVRLLPACQPPTVKVAA